MTYSPEFTSTSCPWIVTTYAVPSSRVRTPIGDVAGCSKRFASTMTVLLLYFMLSPYRFGGDQGGGGIGGLSELRGNGCFEPIQNHLYPSRTNGAQSSRIIFSCELRCRVIDMTCDLSHYVMQCNMPIRLVGD